VVVVVVAAAVAAAAAALVAATPAAPTAGAAPAVPAPVVAPPHLPSRSRGSCSCRLRLRLRQSRRPHLLCDGSARLAAPRRGLLPLQRPHGSRRQQAVFCSVVLQRPHGLGAGGSCSRFTTFLPVESQWRQAAARASHHSSPSTHSAFADSEPRGSLRAVTVADSDAGRDVVGPGQRGRPGPVGGAAPRRAAPPGRVPSP
jgi:hypothetical protein